MRKKIIFQKCKFNNIYFLFMIIINFVDLLIEYKLFKTEDEFKTINKKENIFYLATRILVTLYINNISDFLAIIPHLISKRLLKKKQEAITNVKIEDNNHHDEHGLIYNEQRISVTNKKKNNFLLYFFVVGILDFFQGFVMILYNIIYPDKEFHIHRLSCISPFEISFQFICSYFILKIHFYKLQYFSLFLNLGIFVIILIIDIIKLSIQTNQYDGKVFIFYLLNIIFYSIEYSLGKKIILEGFISIYLLIIIKGSISFILNLLFSLITIFVKKEIFSIIGFYFTDKKYILLMLAKLFSSFFMSLFAWLIIDKFSPNYLPLPLLFYELNTYIIKIIYEPKSFKIEWDIFVRLFLFLVSAVGVMIHNEIMVINLCNLGSDTKYFLDIQVESDELFATTDNPEIMKRFDSQVDIQTEEGIANENKGVLN